MCLIGFHNYIAILLCEAAPVCRIRRSLGQTLRVLSSQYVTHKYASMGQSAHQHVTNSQTSPTEAEYIRWEVCMAFRGCI